MDSTCARRSFAKLLRAAALAAIALTGAGCVPGYVPEDRTDRRPRELQVTAHAGGTHHRTLIENNRWFQSLGNAVLVIDPVNGRELGRVEVMPFGESGSVTDMVVSGDTLFAICDRTAIAEIDVTEAASPKVMAIRDAKSLGLEPRLVSKVGEEYYISGPDGVVRIGDSKRFLAGQAAGRVVDSKEGPITSVGRRILALQDGRYLGAATELQPLPAGVQPAGGYLFVLQGGNGATVGIMSDAFAELGKVEVPAFVRRARLLGDRLWVVTDRILYTWRLDGGKFVEPEEVKLKGARDIDEIRPNHYAVGGTFGRAMYRHKREGRQTEDTFYNVQREPGMLEIALCDGRRVLAGGREGFWRWRIGGEAELVEKSIDVTAIPAKQVSAAWGSARIMTEKSKDSAIEYGASVEVKFGDQTLIYTPTGGPHIVTIALVDGDIWIGHELGVDVLRRIEEPARKDPKTGKMLPPSVRVDPIRELRFEGPALFIFPENLGGGAAVVSLHGGFVLVKPVAVGAAPSFRGRGDLK
ncbi:MAG: hypothetical protein U0625_09240 [Phycisphaerales bacterium]